MPKGIDRVQAYTFRFTEEKPMGRALVAMVAVLLLTASVGWTGETVEGTVKSVDASGQL